VSRLQHPNLVDVYDCGEYEGQLYASMELLPGGALSARLAGRRLALTEAAGFVRALAHAIGAAHRQGVTHGRLMPAKVLFAADGTPKVTGLVAERLRLELEFGAATPAAGVPRYTAPERWSGGGGAPNPTTDVYGLGLILYEVLTGSLPYQAVPLWELLDQVLSKSPEDPRWSATQALARELLDQVLSKPPEPPSRGRPEVAPELDAICLRCLAREPDRRYPSAAALADDLDRLLAGAPLPPPPTEPPPPAAMFDNLDRLLAGAPLLPSAAPEAPTSSPARVAGERRRLGAWARLAGWLTGRARGEDGP
jgi:serine/threonine-protein kinase